MCEAGYGGDAATIWEEWELSARKDRKCESCWGAILKGQRYVRNKCLFEGYWSSTAMCLACRDARKTFTDAHPHSVIPHPTNIRETLEECIEWGDADSEARWQPVLDSLIARGSSLTGEAK